MTSAEQPVTFRFTLLSEAPKTEFSDRLRDARESCEITQKRLAHDLNVSERTVRAWEFGVIPRRDHRRRVMYWVEFAEGLDDGTKFAREMERVRS